MYAKIETKKHYVELKFLFTTAKILLKYICAYLSSGLIDNESANPGDIMCCWKNKFSVCPNELFIFGAEPLRWLNGSNMFEWLLGLKLLKELSGMFTGAEDPWSRPFDEYKKNYI